MPEESKIVALTSTSFEIGGRAASLGDVPSILISEVWADLDELSAQGTGFAPDWESRVGR